MTVPSVLARSACMRSPRCCSSVCDAARATPSLRTQTMPATQYGCRMQRRRRPTLISLSKVWMRIPRGSPR
eukprot:9976859-Lingulodinium_polyedra.AAC.1